MSFSTRQYHTEDLTGSSTGKKKPKADAGETGYNAMRLNQELSIGKTAKVGTAKEILIVPVGMFRAVTQYGGVHVLKCLDPESGDEGVLFLNTKLAEFEEKGKTKHFVAGNFDGNVLTTFGKRTTPGVDGGYDGEYTECDGEWEFDSDFYGKPVYLIRKAIPKKSGKGTYQVLEWRFCEDQEFPDLQEFITAYEDREEERAQAAEEAAPAPAPAKTKKPDTKKKPVDQTPATTKTKPAPKYGPATPARPSTRKAVPEKKSTKPDVTVFIRQKIEENMDPADIILELQVQYDMEEGMAVSLVDTLANGDEDEDADPVYSRAVELFRGGAQTPTVSKQLQKEFRTISQSERLDVLKRANAAVNG